MLVPPRKKCYEIDCVVINTCLVLHILDLGQDTTIPGGEIVHNHHVLGTPVGWSHCNIIVLCQSGWWVFFVFFLAIYKKAKCKKP